jgi:hypothetical protein
MSDHSNRYLAYNKYWGTYINEARKRITSKKLIDIWWEMTAREIQFQDLKREKKIVKNGQVSLIKTKQDFMDFYKFVMRPITDLITEETDCIIEFGSGWGRNIFYLIDQLKGKDIDYYALEYTPNGTNVANILAKTIPDITLYTGQFDYNNPEFELKKKYKHIVIFTRHSIEQVHTMKPDFFNKILDLDCKFDIVHQEPIGWQISQEEKKKIGQEDRNLSEFHTKTYNHHNRNLYSILKKLESENKIKIVDLQIDYCSYRMEWNSSTSLRWEKIHTDS